MATTITDSPRASRRPHAASPGAGLIRAALALAACGALAAGCGGDKKAAAGPRTDDAMIAAWRKGGLEVSALSTVDAKPYQATSCKGGTAGGVDVVLCTYDSGEDGHAAEDLGLAAVGAATGAAVAHGNRLLVVADRHKKDPGGRTIDVILQAFRG